VLCKIYRKATPLKELEQRASAMEEMQRRSNAQYYMNTARAPQVQAAASAGDDYLSSDDAHDSFLFPSSSSSAPSGDSYSPPMEAKQEADLAVVQPPAVRHADLPSLQVPANHGVLDWMQDLSQLRSPWQDQFFLSPLAHLLS